MTIVIEISGTPVAKGRGRAVRAGNHVRVVTPKRTRSWELSARLSAREVVGSMDPLRGPVAVVVLATFSTPASWPTWKREAAITRRIAHTGKPDADNLAKAALDALNGIVWLDDSQVVRLEVRKEWAERPGVRIEVEPFPAASSWITSKRQLMA